MQINDLTIELMKGVCAQCPEQKKNPAECLLHRLHTPSFSDMLELRIRDIRDCLFGVLLYNIIHTRWREGSMEVSQDDVLFKRDRD